MTLSRDLVVAMAPIPNRGLKRMDERGRYQLALVGCNGTDTQSGIETSPEKQVQWPLKSCCNGTDTQSGIETQARERPGNQTAQEVAMAPIPNRGLKRLPPSSLLRSDWMLQWHRYPIGD